MSRTRLHQARELATVFLFYALISVGATWPLARDFSTRLIGDITYDERHAMWLLWHVKEALLGRQPFFTADLVFHPHGASTLIDGVGPMNGFLALPFWPWGPVGAFNGATLLGFALTGWCMYLLVRYGLARDLSSADDRAVRAAACVAGVVYMMWPLHVAGLYGHLEKAFVGLLPLNVLAALLAYDPARSRAWLCAPGITLLLVLLQNGNQFVFALLAVLLIALFVVVARQPGTWRPRIVWPAMRRAIAAGALAIVITGPLLWAVARVARDPAMEVSLAGFSARYAPDVLQFLVPSIHHAIGGRLVYPEYHIVEYDFSRHTRIAGLNATKTWVGSGIETAATIPISVIVLIAIACARLAGAARWLAFSGVFLVLSLGPFLRLAGRTTFTMFELPVVLPYAVLASKPGFDVMRTPGRYILIASVGLAIVAALGLLRVIARAPRRGTVVAALIGAVVLVECWPRVWKQQVLPPVPSFYQRLAQDPERYAVLDLPSGRWRQDLASGYMYYQMTHGKPMMWAFLSRQFVRFPVPGVEGILDDNPPNGAATRAQLVRLGYRYVVWHKRANEVFGTRYPELVGDGRWREPAVDARTNPFIRDAFAHDAPIVDDDLVTVYRLAP